MSTDKPKKERIERRPPKGAPAASDGADEVTDLKEQMARLQADYANFKRRTEEERSAAIVLARTDLALKLLPVIDNLDRAAEHVPETIKEDAWYAGVEGISKQFADILAELGIERIDAVGQPFDPELHEAVSHEPSDEHDKGVVAKELEAGYRMDETVIRPAKVQVSSGKSDNEPDKQSQEEESHD